MIRNYLTVALRNMLRHKGYAAINILGLAIGMATCIVIVRYIQDEFSYDAWHEKGDRIYRVIREARTGGERDVGPQTSGALSQALEAFPEIEKTFRIRIRSRSRNRRRNGYLGMSTQSGRRSVSRVNITVENGRSRRF